MGSESLIMHWYRKVTSGLGRLLTLGGDSANKRTLYLIIALYALLALVMTYPLVTKMTTDVGGYEHKDAFEALWLLWWPQKSLLDLHTSPANLTLQYYPFGAYHPSLLLNPYLFLSSFPFNLAWPPVLAYNFHLLLSYVLSGLSTYLLCYFLTKDKTASFLGGLVFAFSPFRSARAADGHLVYTDTFWFPLYALFLIRMMERPSRRNGLLCGVYLSLSLLVTPVHTTRFTLPFTVLFLCYHALARRRQLLNRNFLRAFAIALGVAAIVIAPFYLPFLTALLSGSLRYLQARVIEHWFSADLLDFFVPPRTHLLVKKIGPLRDLVVRLMPEPPFEERVVYAGIVPLILTILAAWRDRAKAGFWVILGVLSGLLALGPTLRVGGQEVQYTLQGTSRAITLPYALLNRLPLYEFARVPARHDMTVMLCLGVLVSQGVATLGKMGRTRLRNTIIGCGLAVLILLEYAVVFPFPTAKVQIPEFYHTIASDEGDYGILDLGTGKSHSRAKLFQTVHQHGIVTFYINRVLPEGRFNDCLAVQLFTPSLKIVQGLDPLQILGQMRVRYVVLHKDPRYPEAWNHLPTIMELLGKPVYEDLQIAAWEVPLTIGGIGDALMAVFDRGWHPVEMVEGKPARWMKMGAEILVKAFTTGRYRLEALVEPFHPPKNLWVLVNKERVDEFNLDRPKRVVTQPFTLHQEGINRIGLFVPEGCERPSELFPGNEDDRCLGVLIREVELIPISEAPY